MKFLFEHKLSREVRYARLHFEAGPTSVPFSLDGQVPTGGVLTAH